MIIWERCSCGAAVFALGSTQDWRATHNCVPDDPFDATPTPGFSQVELSPAMTWPMEDHKLGFQRNVLS